MDAGREPVRSIREVDRGASVGDSWKRVGDEASLSITWVWPSEEVLESDGIEPFENTPALKLSDKLRRRPMIVVVVFEHSSRLCGLGPDSLTGGREQGKE